MHCFATKLARHGLPVLLAGVALIVPVLGASGGEATGFAGSVVAKAAQAEGTPGGDQRYPVGGSAMETARSIAVSHWGANPCGGTYELAWTPLDPGTNATASWRNPTDAWNNAGANFDCRIDLNPDADYNFAKLCTVLAHEMGHLLGRQHDPGSGQLMSAYYSTPLPACENREPAASAAAVEQPAETDADGIDIIATDEPRRTLSRKTAKAKTTTKTVRRCVMRKARGGKRVKRCRTVKVKVKATKAAKGKSAARRAER